MKPGVLAGIIVAVILGVGVLAFLGTKEDTSTQKSNAGQSTQTVTNSKAEQANEEQQTSQAAGDSTELAQGITMAEVGTHATADDCWTVIDGSVYDITEYVPRHPGGEEILQACGVDGTSLFMTRTTEDGETVGSGEPHSSKAQSQLAGFKIGDLN